MNPTVLAAVQAARARLAAQAANKNAPAAAPAQATPAAALAAHQQAIAKPAAVAASTLVSSTPNVLLATRTFSGTNLDKFNEQQRAAIELALQGKSFCVTGAAGTGKTTVMQTIIELLQRCDHVVPLATNSKYLNAKTPGIVVTSFTITAVENIRSKLPIHLQSHCINIHKLIEYEPNYYEVVGEDGNLRTTMRFEPGRNSTNPLPHISTLIFEESSMIGTDLYQEVLAALPAPHKTQFIFLGDLNQIKPVFGHSIFGFSMTKLPVVELTHVYRQALLSPIISLATAVRTNNLASKFTKPAAAWHDANYDQTHLPWALNATSGNSVDKKRTVIDRGEHGKLTIHPWAKRVDKEVALNMMKIQLPRWIEEGSYAPEADMVLCPFNKSFGTIELNKIIANYLATQRDEVTYEVIARYNKTYWAVGDRVFYNRQNCFIRKIYPTPGYYGKTPALPSKTLNRWGVDPNNKSLLQESAPSGLDALDDLAVDEEDAINKASHTLVLWVPSTDTEIEVNTAGDINNLLLGYVLTIHKSQGSEWNRVFMLLHSSHATMLSRELIYTGITRARKELYIVCEGDDKTYPNSLARAAGAPVIPGTSLADKIAYFTALDKQEKKTTF